MADVELSIEDLEALDTEILTNDQERQRRTKTKSSGSKSRTRSGPLKTRIAAMVKLLGNMLAGFEKYDGQVLIDAAPEIAEQLDLLARENPRVRRILETSLEGGAWTGVIAVVGTKVMVPIAVHHRLLPEPVNSGLAEMLEIPVREPRDGTGDDDSSGDVSPVPPGIRVPANLLDETG